MLRQYSRGLRIRSAVPACTWRARERLHRYRAGFGFALLCSGRNIRT